jgi:hypothetical protein
MEEMRLTDYYVSPRVLKFPSADIVLENVFEGGLEAWVRALILAWAA